MDVAGRPSLTLAVYAQPRPTADLAIANSRLRFSPSTPLQNRYGHDGDVITFKPFRVS